MNDRPDATPSTAPSAPTVKEFVELVREDLAAHDGKLSTPGFQAVFAVRVGQLARSVRPAPLRKVVSFAYHMLRRRARDRFGIEMHARMTLGRRVRIVHQSGIVFHERTVVGDDCLIRHGVTLGGVDDWKPDEHPTLGRDVWIGAGAAIVGRVTVGDGARIGPNAVVISDVPAGAMVFAPRSRTIKLS